ncbi:MAG: SufD family Fe-S cluster assembly protein [Hyphomonas sp.]|uniref:SufB/SufD family protein n=1 Tax=Hyphomonas sp. TaxID=87 RepID=UPI00184355EA|nr:SufD family Fe-S cluster assembly protein [Hyphomonas sp.]MBU3920322.1 SufD family Fe-S cluster assembly protein [Alphaproteobacteria bacterium]MBA3068024.1 SufD family Fe-S cluster assembly protein [Hyphomonas sp.]MBU4061363.1 SufD family Fe-S cluster assembly protein [Alphaproteobacteria bacterium]MBU4162616.1 SufD family Fe-S cluster assembly protein [Alphaproteobacteria bacterium]MBU4569541.1 SufD family Fe-S cluster assembly protein [Alphaproteobacteria bacterium]
MSTALRDILRNPTVAELELVARYAGLKVDARRERLFEAFALTGLPGRRDENWRWSDFKSAVTALDAPKTPPAHDPLARGGVATLRFSPSGFAAPSALPAGVRLVTREDVQAMGGAEDVPLGALAAALSGTVQVEVSAEAPVHLHMVFQGPGAIHAARIAFLLRPGTELHVSESHLGGAAFSAALIEFTLQAGARLNRTIYQRGGAGEVQAITALIEQDAGAESVQTVLAFGAKVSRIETRLVHRETGSKATLNAAYLAGKGFHADITTHVRHGAPACTTRQQTKGAVLDGGRGVFRGKFLVPRTSGQQTDASMQHNALLLEEGAEVFAKPELEILADDVQCAHGNTSGALDGTQLFYLRQRGIPLVQARAMLTEAHIAQALEGAGEHEDALRTEASRWLAP